MAVLLGFFFLSSFFWWVRQVLRVRNEDAVFCRSSMSLSTTPFWKPVSAATPPSPPVSCAPSTMTWTGWTRRPTPAPLRRSSGWGAWDESAAEVAGITLRSKKHLLVYQSMKLMIFIIIIMCLWALGVLVIIISHCLISWNCREFEQPEIWIDTTSFPYIFF